VVLIAVVVFGWSLVSAFGGISSLASTLTPSSAAYQYGPYGKVTICHRADDKKTVTITISQSALPAHLKHGDTIGPCP
jgi:hypothetical protein